VKTELLEKLRHGRTGNICRACDASADDDPANAPAASITHTVTHSVTHDETPKPPLANSGPGRSKAAMRQARYRAKDPERYRQRHRDLIRRRRAAARV
jgi:hypothetical protein